MPAMIQLVGGQPLPNLLPALHIGPNVVLLAYTDLTQSVGQRLKSLMEGVGMTCQPIPCDAYDIPKIIAALEDAIAPLQGDELIYNLTGGTKAMVLAANQLAVRTHSRIVYLESEKGDSKLYHYRYDTQGCLLYERDEILPELLTVAQFLDAHIGCQNWKETGPSKDKGGDFEKAVAAVLKTKLPQVEVCQGIRFLGSQDGKKPQADLDIVVRCGNQLARIECKSGGKSSTLDAAKQLSLVTELLGTYTRKFIAMSGKPNADHQAVYEATRTTVIELSSFDGASLSDEDQNKLAGEITRALRCKDQQPCSSSTTPTRSPPTTAHTSSS